MGLTLGSKIPRYVFYHLNAFHCNLHKAFLGPFKGTHTKNLTRNLRTYKQKHETTVLLVYAC